MRDRHFDCYIDLARTAMESGEGAEWPAVFDAELANIRTALEWGLATSRPETAMFARSLSWYWRTRRLYSEGRQILDRVLRQRHLPPVERADLQLVAAWLASDQGEPEVARDHYEVARRLAGSEGDALRQARAAQGLGWCLFKLLLIGGAVEAFSEARELSAVLPLSERADVLRGLGWARAYNEGPEVSLELHREARALLEEAADPALTSHYLVETNLLVGCGRVEEALALADKSVEFARATGRPLSHALAAKSNAAEASGDRELLEQVLDEGIKVSREEETPTVEITLHRRRAMSAMYAGETDVARDALDSALRLLDGIDVLNFIDVASRAQILVSRARVADDEGQVELAHELYRQAIAIYSRSSAHSHAEALIGLARLYADHGDAQAAGAVEREAVELLDRIDNEVGAMVRVDFAVLAGDLDEALRLTTGALETAAEKMPRDVPALLFRKAALLAGLGRLDEAALAIDELVATGRGGPMALLDRARLHIASDNDQEARSNLVQVARVARLGWASHQLELATTLARLALLEGRRDRAEELWAAVVAYRTANRRLAPPLSRSFEAPLRELPGGAPPALDSRASLEVLRALVSDEFGALAGPSD